MNITDETKVWKVEDGQITNTRTGNVRRVSGLPSASFIAYMDSGDFTRKCAVAFQAGKWPLTCKVCAYCQQERYEQ